MGLRLENWWQKIGFTMGGVYLMIFLWGPMLLFIGTTTSGRDNIPATTCHRFPTQYVAQLFYDEFRSDKTFDLTALDPDGNRIVCEEGPFLSSSSYRSRFGNVLYIYEQG